MYSRNQRLRLSPDEKIVLMVVVRQTDAEGRRQNRPQNERRIVMIYICKECGAVTEEPNSYTNRIFLDGVFYEEEFLGECSCGGEYAEAQYCPECNSYYTGEYDVCDECLAEKMTFDHVRLYSDDRKFEDEDVKIPRYIANILGDEVIVDVLFCELKKHFDGYTDGVKKFLAEDMDDFLSWLKEKRGNEVA